MITFFVFIGIMYSLMKAGHFLWKWFDSLDVADGFSVMFYGFFGAFGIYALIVGK